MYVSVLDGFYKLLHPCITVLVASVSRSGRPNVMACAWNMPVSEEPPMIAIAIGRESYTNELIKESGEFTVNILGQEYLEAIWICGTRSGRNIDKFRLANLTLEPARRVKPPIIKECAAYLECKLHNYVDSGECTIFIGEVLDAYASKEVFSKDGWNIEKIGLPLHLGGRLFTIPREIIQPKLRK
ncbi:MAG: flavin reductase family protein [Nitrososphaeria archaeon]|nr:flavin reductase family protein [Nitrososphaeria archaeon]